MCAPFCQGPVQLPARARSLFLVKNVRVRADGHSGSVHLCFVASYLSWRGGSTAAASIGACAAPLEAGEYR
jgi:hypothetical protein